MASRLLSGLCCLAALGAAQGTNFCTGRRQQQCAGDCRWDGVACDQICFRPNTAFTPDMQTQPVPRVSSQELCREHCRNIPGCTHFTYYSFTRSCHLQDARASRQQAAGAVSGEPDCGGGGIVPQPVPQPAPHPAPQPAPWHPAGPVLVHLSTTPRWAPPAPQPAWRAPPPSFGTESMPGSVGRVMQVGSVQAAARFSGLFFARDQILLERSRHWLVCLGTLAVCTSAGLALLAVYRRRVGGQAPRERSEMPLCAAGASLDEE